MAIRDWHWPQWMLLSGGILLAVLLSVVIYVLLTPNALVPTPAQPTPLPGGGLPQVTPGAPSFPPSDIEKIPLGQLQGTDINRGPDLIAKGGVTVTDNVTQFPVDFVSLAPNGNSLNYYDPDTKRFYRVDGNGIITKIGEQIFADVQNVVWAPNAQDAIVEFPDSSNIVYNFETNDQVTLPAHWDDFSFSPSSESIAFKSNALDPEERWLAVSDKNGSSARKIENLGDNGNILTVDWSPNNQVIGTWSEPDGLSHSNLYFLGFNGENFPLSKLEGLKFEGRWTPSGKQVLYSVINQNSNFNPTLWLVDGSGTTMGQNRHPIGLPTWTNKCTFASETEVYCGVPRQLPQGAGLIPSIANDIPDDIYQVNLTNGAITKTATPTTDLNVERMTVSEDGSTLFVQDRFTGSVKKIQLK